MITRYDKLAMLGPLALALVAMPATAAAQQAPARSAAPAAAQPKAASPKPAATRPTAAAPSAAKQTPAKPPTAAAPATRQPASKQPAAAPKRPVDPADAAAKKKILDSYEWHRAMFELTEWLSAQSIYSKQQVAQIEADFNRQVAEMSGVELSFVLADMQEKFKIMESSEAKEAPTGSAAICRS